MGTEQLKVPGTDKAEPAAAAPVQEVSIFDFDTSRDCETPFEFEYIRESTGRGSGLYVTIMGDHASVVKNYERKRLNESRARAEMAKKKGKDEPTTTIEEDLEFGAELAAIRIVSWRGVKEPFTFDTAVKLCMRSPDFLTQVRKQSADLANFTGNSKKA